jgi:polyisoprenoid-binding protein YceI
MRFALWLVAGSLLFAGCGKKAAETPPAAPAPSAAAPAAEESAVGSPQTAAIKGPMLTIPGAADAQAEKVIQLTPQNTVIEFVGKHTDPSREDRVCIFEKFNGQAVLDGGSKTLKSVSVEMETGSLKTFNSGLTRHLNSDDFLDTRAFPTATFKSTRIEKEDRGKARIVGDLTLHGVTKEISIPANVTIGDNGLTLKGALTIDRTDYGMNRQLEGVKKEVDITVTVGDAAEAVN